MPTRVQATGNRLLVRMAELVVVLARFFEAGDLLGREAQHCLVPLQLLIRVIGLCVVPVGLPRRCG